VPASDPSNASRTVGERLKAARLELGVSQMDLAYLAGMNVANYGKIERGIGNPTLDSLVRLAGVMGLDPGTLVAGLGLSDLPPVKSSYTVAEFLREKQRKAH
jgi:transcriptional regulator with XRE-family HTH domain